jgi:predicted short-subunit dehydrogenase-like oxidoreductase (DUF2520 family)
MSELEQISWIGCGKVGQTLAKALKNSGYRIGAILCKKLENAKKAQKFIGAGEAVSSFEDAVESGSVHFVTTSDDAISDVVREIETHTGSLTNHYFFHTSGALNSTILEPLKSKGAEIASIHPLQVFADPAKALESLPGIYYTIEGGDRAMTLAIQMIERLQGKLLLIPTGRKVLYHIAGVFAANYVTVLVDVALRIMQDLGETQEEAYQAFLPLMVGALENIEEFGVEQALTGPVARGDAETLNRHVEALNQLDPELVTLYKVLGQRAVEIAARGGGLNADKARRLLEILR